MTDFILISPDSIPDEALKWLQISIDKTPNSDMTLVEILGRGKQGIGEFYLVKSDKLLGCIYIEWLDWALNVVLLGGDYIKPWTNDLHDFCIKIMREKKINTCIFVGRYGLGKLFPQFKSIGMMYVLKDEGVGGEGH